MFFFVSDYPPGDGICRFATKGASRMRYPLVLFLVLFVMAPYTAHAVLSGSARFQPRPDHSTAQLAQRGKIQSAGHQVAGGVLISTNLSCPAAQPQHC